MKMRMGLVVFILSGLLVGFGVNEIFAHCGECGTKLPHAEKGTRGETITFQAEVICLGCTLKKEQGAKAQCSIYGHRNALRTAGGKIWTILENDASTELINSHEYKGKSVEITGKKLIGAKIIEVESVKVVEQ